jgi:ribosomal protein L12E/L44/L45/RPP1/RPP2
MVAPALDEAHLKDVLKSALVEVLEERADLLREVLAEVLEDVALARAIREGEGSGTAPREEIFRVLDAAE